MAIPGNFPPPVPDGNGVLNGTNNVSLQVAGANRLQVTSTTTGLNGNAPVAKAAAIAAPTAPGAAYVQAEATSAKTAIDAIRVALTNIGITL